VSLLESQDKIEDQEISAPVNKRLIDNEKESIGSTIKESQDFIPVGNTENQPFNKPHSPDKSMNTEGMFPQTEQSSLKEEEPAEISKTKVADSVISTTTPERKTVTFAEKHKEIPAVSYSQSQKGILIVNGTNRPNQTAEQG
jgi:hypothetical protein